MYFHSVWNIFLSITEELVNETSDLAKKYVDIGDKQIKIKTSLYSMATQYGLKKRNSNMFDIIYGDFLRSWNL